MNQLSINKLHERLSQFINKLADISGHPWLLITAATLVALWFVVGLFFQYDSTWFDIMDVFIFLSTFFLVFIVQASQNADMQAIQDKLDGIVEASSKASNKAKGEEKRIKSGKKAAR